MMTTDDFNLFRSRAERRDKKRRMPIFEVTIYTHGSVYDYYPIERNCVPIVTKGSIDFDKNENTIKIPYRTDARRYRLFERGPGRLQLYSYYERGGVER